MMSPTERRPSRDEVARAKDRLTADEAGHIVFWGLVTAVCLFAWLGAAAALVGVSTWRVWRRREAGASDATASGVLWRSLGGVAVVGVGAWAALGPVRRRANLAVREAGRRPGPAAGAGGSSTRER